jgi:hypothetical protein
VVIPLTLETYNARLAEASLERFQLPTPAAGGHNSGGPSKSHLLVLVGNSKALWPPFLEFVGQEMAARGGDVEPDPIDRYVKQSVGSAIDKLPVPPANVYRSSGQLHPLSDRCSKR